MISKVSLSDKRELKKTLSVQHGDKTLHYANSNTMLIANIRSDKTHTTDKTASCSFRQRMTHTFSLSAECTERISLEIWLTYGTFPAKLSK